MSFFYNLTAVNKTLCIGNTLSTLNLNLSSLDLNLQATSALAFQNDLDITLLLNEVDNLSSSIDSVSSIAMELSSYYTPQTLTQSGEYGIIWMDAVDGVNAKVTLVTNGKIDDIGNLKEGDRGSIVIQNSPTTGVSITGYGSKWLFRNSDQSMNITINSYNVINYYYSGDIIFGDMLRY